MYDYEVDVRMRTCNFVAAAFVSCTGFFHMGLPIRILDSSCCVLAVTNHLTAVRCQLPVLRAVYLLARLGFASTIISHA
jgi:hypothetical protein